VNLNILVLGERGWCSDSSVAELTIFCEPDYSKVNVKVVDGLLFLLVDSREFVKIDGVILRGQFQENTEVERYVLEIVDYSEACALNSCSVVLNYGSSYSMHSFLKKSELPVLTRVLTFGRNVLPYEAPQFPLVLRVGNFHMGYGKSLVRDKEHWDDCIDTAILLNQIVSLEPFVRYVTDVRCLFLGGRVSAIKRTPSIWKANVSPAEVKECVLPDVLNEYTIRIAHLLKADVFSADFILDEKQAWHLLEVNLNPGLMDGEKDQFAINDILISKVFKCRYDLS
jgi:ribosomal protein S6--L-glutamate ligase